MARLSTLFPLPNQDKFGKLPLTFSARASTSYGKNNSKKVSILNLNATNQGTFIEIPHFTPKILYLVLHSNQNYGDNSTTNLYQNQSNMPSKISIPLLVIEILNPWQGFIHGDKGVRLYRKTKNLGTTSKYIQIVITRKN